MYKTQTDIRLSDILRLTGSTKPHKKVCILREDDKGQKLLDFVSIREAEMLHMQGRLIQYILPQTG